MTEGTSVQTDKRIAIVGMGAAGSMAGIIAARSGARVEIFERNEKLGKKLYITGKGRCNVTNATPMPAFMEHIPHNAKFLFSALNRFAGKDLMALLESYGLKLKVERGARVFPQSDHASDVNRTLERALVSHGAVLHKNARVESIGYDERTGRFTLVVNGEFEVFDRVIIATGGLSYPSTGSTGDGYRFAEQLGHTITPCTPALVALQCADRWIPDCEGLSLKHITLHALVGRRRYAHFGEMIFTRDGISGPTALTLSSELSGADPDTVQLWIDWKPMLDEQQLYARLISLRDTRSNGMLRTMLEDFLPKRMVKIFAEALNLDLRRPINHWEKGNQQAFVHLLKHFPLTYVAHGSFKQAVVTRGGVAVREIDPSTMASKRIPGLYFAGEVIDVDGFTGGYNLQIAFSTGVLAGESCAHSLEA